MYSELRAEMNLRLLVYVGTLCSFLMIFPISAHEVQISDEVGGTLHIEPNDQAKAGEQSQAWFILTKSGGQVIPFTQCDCKLAVYKRPIAANASPILQPVLKPISAEQYQDMPGTSIIFPSVGAYELKLMGSPKSGETFKPFELSYAVIVAVGKPVKDSPSPQSTILSKTPEIVTTSETDSQGDSGLIVGAIAAVVVIAGGAVWLVRKSQK